MENTLSTNEAVLEVRNLTCIAKKTGVTIVDNVSFKIMPGETIGLLGESGVGKTTLFRAILQLLVPSVWTIEGDILIDGKQINLSSPKELERIRGELVRCIFQEPAQSLNPSIKVGKQIKEAIKVIRPDVNDSELSDLALTSLKKAGIPSPEALLDCYPGELSGGQRQRVGIALSICCNCSLLLADEPSSSLDSITTAEMISTLKDMKSSGTIKAILCVTHDICILGALECNRVIFMDGGKIYEAGSLENTTETPCHEKLGQLISLSRSLSTAHDSSDDSNRLNSHSTYNIKGLTFSYNRKKFLFNEEKEVIKDLHFNIKKGEIVGLVGSSGSGKSTIGKFLSRILKSEPGVIFFEGKDINKSLRKKDKTDFHRSVQVIFQDTADTFDPSLTIKKNLYECYEAMGLTEGEIQKVFQEMMPALSLHRRLLDEIPRNLSGGQKQRFALMRAFGVNPHMVIADEPFTHLDLFSQKKLVDYFQHRKSDKENPLSCLLISHEIGLVSRICDRVCVIDNGRIVEDKKASEIIFEPEHILSQTLIGAARDLGTLTF